jgi:hypothetical protein
MAANKAETKHTQRHSSIRYRGPNSNLICSHVQAIDSLRAVLVVDYEVALVTAQHWNYKCDAGRKGFCACHDKLIVVFIQLKIEIECLN